MSLSVDDFRARLATVRGRLAAAAERVDRDPATITLVAVSKTFPAETVALAVAAGVTDLGENRVQEAVAKAATVVAPGLAWHLIGPLQRNKARAAVETFALIHTLDRPALADRLATLVEELRPGDRQPVLIEVNLGGEAQKAGVGPGAAADLLDHTLALPQLEVRGLMAIPPWAEEAEASRPHFRALAELRARLEDHAGVALPELSMGMSHDFEVAVEEGATLVRVGTAIFGPR